MAQRMQQPSLSQHRPETLYSIWCRLHNCTHGHCPEGCEHPQPGHYAGDERLLCGAHWFDGRQAVEIEPCRPETCRDAL